MVFSVMISLLEGKTDEIEPVYQKWFYLLLLIFILLLVNGLFIYQNELNAAFFDSMMFMSVFAGILAGCKKQNLVIVDKLMFAVFLACTFFCLVNFTTFIQKAILSTRIDRSDYTWDSFYYVWGIIGTLWPYFILSMKDKSMLRKVATFIGTGVFFLAAVIYLKRSPIIQLVVFISLLLTKSDKRAVLKISLGLLLSLMVLWTALGYFHMNSFQENLMSRIFGDEGIWNNFLQDPRISYDIKLVYNQLSGVQWLTGLGLGGSVVDYLGIYTYELTPMLHNGMAFLILKGGILLLLVWVSGGMYFLVKFMRENNLDMNRYYIPFLTIFLLSFYEASLSLSAYFAFYMTCVGATMSKQKSQQLNFCAETS